MHLKRLHQIVSKVMCHWINRTCRVYPIDIHCMVPYEAPKKMYYPVLSPELEAMFTKCYYKFCHLTSSIRLRPNIKNINNISLKFTMLTDKNQIFGSWFVIIHRHLTKVSAQVIQCIIFERNELSITLSTLCYDRRSFRRATLIDIL